MAKPANTSSISFRLTEEEKKMLEQYCEENDLSMSQVIRRAVKEYIKN